MDLSSVPLLPEPFSIGKKFLFGAGHQPARLVLEHKCVRQHGQSKSCV
ncbi:hypothetical protein [Streptomyces sp. NBC_00439]|nr:hypothetical protein [Streptomyces sp. NBC_00439]MCX5103637.1 hypothetical protein [Streptomyces sp. NBC_00439]WSX06220.1 hypothetical protein OG355_40540 [Streptomyces sp. NBC_00987]